jgi:hypothetical protein
MLVGLNEVLIVPSDDFDSAVFKSSGLLSEM